MEAQSSTAASLQIRRNFAAPRERVFEAWTKEEALKQWFCHEGYTTLRAEADVRVGGGYKMVMKKDGDDADPFHVEGTYQAVVPPEKLVFTWRWSHRPEMNDTRVTVEFRDAGGSTELVLTHELFGGEQLRNEHNTGWNLVLKSLTSYLG
jgi:uncharacterized protein YndB with AHSA1/START domain